MGGRRGQRLRVDVSEATPLWSQVEEGVRLMVASGTWSASGPVPSVRELARQLRINPATVVKAYARLTEAGVLEVRRGDGTYVAAQPAVGAADRIRQLGQAARRYAALALTAGVTREQALDELRRAWSELAARKGDTDGE